MIHQGTNQIIKNNHNDSKYGHVRSFEPNLAEQKRIKRQTMFYMESFSKAWKIKANV